MIRILCSLVLMTSFLIPGSLSAQFAFPDGGVPITASAEKFSNRSTTILGDNHFACAFTQSDLQAVNAIWVQIMNAEGQQLEHPVRLSGADNHAWLGQFCQIDEGLGVAIWIEEVAPQEYEYRIQCVNTAGEIQWAEGGIPLLRDDFLAYGYFGKLYSAQDGTFYAICHPNEDDQVIFRLNREGQFAEEWDENGRELNADLIVLADRNRLLYTIDQEFNLILPDGNLQYEEPRIFECDFDPERTQLKEVRPTTEDRFYLIYRDIPRDTYLATMNDEEGDILIAGIFGDWGEARIYAWDVDQAGRLAYVYTDRDEMFCDFFVNRFEPDQQEHYPWQEGSYIEQGGGDWYPFDFHIRCQANDGIFVVYSISSGINQASVSTEMSCYSPEGEPLRGGRILSNMFCRQWVEGFQITPNGQFFLAVITLPDNNDETEIFHQGELSCFLYDEQGQNQFDEPVSLQAGKMGLMRNLQTAITRDGRYRQVWDNSEAGVFIQETDPDGEQMFETGGRLVFPKYHSELQLFDQYEAESATYLFFSSRIWEPWRPLGEFVLCLDENLEATFTIDPPALELGRILDYTHLNGNTLALALTLQDGNLPLLLINQEGLVEQNTYDPEFEIESVDRLQSWPGQGLLLVGSLSEDQNRDSFCMLLNEQGAALWDDPVILEGKDVYDFLITGDEIQILQAYEYESWNCYSVMVTWVSAAGELVEAQERTITTNPDNSGYVWDAKLSETGAVWVRFRNGFQCVSADNESLMGPEGWLWGKTSNVILDENQGAWLFWTGERNEVSRMVHLDQNARPMDNRWTPVGLALFPDDREHVDELYAACYDTHLDAVWLTTAHPHHLDRIKLPTRINVQMVGDQWVGIQDDIKPTPLEFSLEPAYPNPFNAVTMLNFTLPAPGLTKLTVFDYLGREVTTLQDGFLSAGAHQIGFKADGLTSGVYLIRMQDERGGMMGMQKVVLVR